MVASLKKVDAGILYQVDDAMFLCQTPRPRIGTKMLQWFRFADTLEWIAQDVVDDLQRTKADFTVGFYPVL